MARKGGTVCAYRACSSKTGGEISLFTFPKDRSKAELWLKACNRDDLLEKTGEELSKNYKLCEKHFEEKYISKGSETRKHLFEQAVPTIFPHLMKRSANEISTSEEPAKKVVISDIKIMPATSAEHTSLAAKLSPCSSFPSGTFSTQTCQNLSANLPIDTEESSSMKHLECLTIDIAGPSHSKPTSPMLSPVSTQTPAALTASSPRKQKLREKLKAYRKKSGAKNIVSKRREWNLQDFHEMCEKFLDKPFAEIVKAQAAMKDRKPLARRLFYSLKYVNRDVKSKNQQKNVKINILSHI